MKPGANIGKMIRPQFVNGHWRTPVIAGRNKAKLKNHFQAAGVPWIYEKEKPEIHRSSSYNRRPKGTKRYLNYEARLAMIRKNLSTQDERLEKYR